jgi:hypothetical protein
MILLLLAAVRASGALRITMNDAMVTTRAVQRCCLSPTPTDDACRIQTVACRHLKQFKRGGTHGHRTQIRILLGLLNRKPSHSRHLWVGLPLNTDNAQ